LNYHFNSLKNNIFIHYLKPPLLNVLKADYHFLLVVSFSLEVQSLLPIKVQELHFVQQQLFQIVLLIILVLK